ncbi:hypothetical protein BaRGS_00000095 [Batillaria attramentaria]|uniref:Uncharacterized protein n=1 Tax=Batillaria attramentaria TaxID=370345 RepID=A0ABD0M9P0_9CAEN
MCEQSGKEIYFGHTAPAQPLVSLKMDSQIAFSSSRFPVMGAFSRLKCRRISIQMVLSRQHRGRERTGVLSDCSKENHQTSTTQEQLLLDRLILHWRLMISALNGMGTTNRIKTPKTVNTASFFPLSVYFEKEKYQNSTRPIQEAEPSVCFYFCRLLLHRYTSCGCFWSRVFLRGQWQGPSIATSMDSFCRMVLVCSSGKPLPTDVMGFFVTKKEKKNFSQTALVFFFSLSTVF